MTTIQQHYERLRQTDLRSWNAMNGQLASRLNKRSDCLTYFRRSILETEAHGPDAIDMAILPAWIARQFVEYLGFSWEDIWNNSIPTLEELDTQPA